MAQNDLVIANQSFPSFRSDLNSALQAIQTTHSGTSLPTGALAGQIWLDTSSATAPTLKIYDGTDSISLAIIDYTTNTVNWLDSSLSYNSTATSAGTLVLTVSSSYKQYFTGTTTHTVTLPVASTLTVGQTFEIHNNSTGSITVNSSGSNLVGTVEANVTASITCILASGTTAASWDFDVTGFSSAVPTTRGGTGLTTIGSSLQVLRTNSGATGLEFATIGGTTTPFTVTGDNVSGASIRLPEDTDNGSNYVALKAPDTLASNLTLTLPSADGTSGQVLQTNGSGVLSFSSVADNFSTKLFHVRDEKSAGTAGGGFTSGLYQTRTLNTVITNEISGASLASNQITLPSGTYYVIAKALAHKVNFNKLKLRNVTDPVDTLVGFTGMEWDATDSEGCNFVDGRFTITAQKVFELQHRCSATRATDGFGRSENSMGGVVEVFSDVQIWKVA